MLCSLYFPSNIWLWKYSYLQQSWKNFAVNTCIPPLKFHHQHFIKIVLLPVITGTFSPRVSYCSTTDYPKLRSLFKTISIFYLMCGLILVSQEFGSVFSEWFWLAGGGMLWGCGPDIGRGYSHLQLDWGGTVHCQEGLLIWLRAGTRNDGTRQCPKGLLTGSDPEMLGSVCRIQGRLCPEGTCLHPLPKSRAFHPGEMVTHMQRENLAWGGKQNESRSAVRTAGQKGFQGIDYIEEGGFNGFF